MGEIVKIGLLEKFKLKMPSDRAFSGLSENHKMFAIGLSKLKLWQF